ncbi:TrfB-related DNA-binding protein [Xylella fastidiosa subsp. sandyi]|uniref:TrfB-related DNA-binding protein n=1 Tax=Xylella fastidiosa TaxID=2371 RepID=UPI00070767F7|nr:TrfB-related DNA-binding protein [Xylella fastidiosa]KQH72932.1 hypothetical protein AOT81_11190 [Xylella fastidiosa]RWA43724.1 hypothetical protein XfCFBP8356_10200 [Xylella fastidiosa subsp. sandyi]WNY19868.1 TrfB-related DNA-binding protein [Xylella fastidiosa]WNY22162.1 TrfB-related DNA-binding protein [Xylella fastidiosa]
MKPGKKITSQDFEKLRPYLSRFKEQNIEAIRKILVDGQQQTNVANTLGVTNKAVSYMVRKAWQTYIKHGERPEGWISISVTLPPDMAELVKDIERKAREKLVKRKS